MSRIIALLIALSTSVSGCTSTASIYSKPSTAILVRQDNYVLFIRRLDATERQRLRKFVATATRGRSDALHLLVSASPRLSAEIVSQIEKMGIDAHSIHLIGEHEGETARVDAVVFKALPPVCPSLSSPKLDDDAFDQTLGCSIRHNLVVMINDPRDLLDHQTAGPSDGDRAGIPVAKYRTFTTDPNSRPE
ncbi:CpaD family pilus assembly lipoprotein [Rhizobium grahamii]|uniref:Pilus assembly protein CpaD n=1 Tax=Rhizobium grahamii TaxID=1120045 RepID=A0A370KH91_9HYPH|nr:CpaD family pilus assembly lipoprotein [Rhizobium grahamii]RDJ04509.1 hypothetical protein B5K06_27105 [Rhizobium grahamii]